jgi:hypothetical protein
MTQSTAPILRFPSDLVDHDDVPLLVGAWVTVLAGPHAGEHGEVTDWAGGRRVRVAIENSANPFPELHTVDGSDVAIDSTSKRIRTSAGLEIHDPTDAHVLLIAPIGGQDVQIAPHGDRGPFPDPGDFLTDRTARQTKIDARRWGQACLDTIDGLPAAEQAQTVARHLDAPMLRRALLDATLPATVTRLVFVVSDQDAPQHQHDDTVAFGRLLELWLAGSDQRRARTVAEVTDPIVLRRDPHLTHAVLCAVRQELSRLLDGIDQVVVLQAGGTPAMTMGSVLAAATGIGVPIRVLTPAKDGPLVEARFPALVPAADVARVANQATERGQTDIADALRALLGPSLRVTDQGSAGSDTAFDES